jgi:hypothetical protein
MGKVYHVFLDTYYKSNVPSIFHTTFGDSTSSYAFYQLTSIHKSVGRRKTLYGLPSLTNSDKIHVQANMHSADSHLILSLSKKNLHLSSSSGNSLRRRCLSAILLVTKSVDLMNYSTKLFFHYIFCW